MELDKLNGLFESSITITGVEFENLYPLEYKYRLELFYNITFPKVILEGDVVEFHISEQIRKDTRDWYSLDEDVYPFLYKIDDDGTLVLTRIHYANDNHLLRGVADFSYYSIREIPYDECFCFKNELCTIDNHFINMRSTEGCNYGACTQYTLYNCTFQNKHYDVVQVCSECSLLYVNDDIYSIYLTDKLKDEDIPPEYKPVPFYQQFALGDEPGYWSNDSTLDLEKISYKLGIKIVQDFQSDIRQYTNGEHVFDYYFDYKTSEAKLSYPEPEDNFDKYCMARFYTHIGKKMN